MIISNFVKESLRQKLSVKEYTDISDSLYELIRNTELLIKEQWQFDNELKKLEDKI